MKNVNFREIGMENFGGYQDVMSLQIADSKLTLITGPNGSGKTTIFDSVAYSFYGVTTKGLRGEDVINNRVGKNCFTWVNFEIDNVPYKVERYVKYTKKGSTVFLFRGDEKIPYKKGHQEVTSEIEKLLVPEKLFMNTILFASSKKAKTFFTDLTDSQRKEIFKYILQLEQYVIYQKEASNKAIQKEKEILNVKQNIEVTKALIEQNNSQIEILKNQENDFNILKEFKIKNLKLKIKELKDYIIVKNDQISLLDEEKVLKEQNEINKHISLVQKEIKDLIDKEESEIILINSKSEIKISEFRQLSSDKKLQITKIKQNNIDKLNETTGKEIENLREELNSIKSDIQSTEAKIDLNNENIKSLKLSNDQNIIHIKSKINSKEDNIKSLKLSKDQNQLHIEGKIEAKNSHIKNLELAREQKLLTINSNIKLKENNIKNLNEKKDEFHKHLQEEIPTCPTCNQKIGLEKLEELKKKIVSFDEEIKENKKEIKLIEEEIKKNNLDCIDKIKLTNEEIKLIEEEIKESNIEFDKKINLVKIEIKLIEEEIEESNIEFNKKIDSENKTIESYKNIQNKLINSKTEIIIKGKKKKEYYDEKVNYFNDEFNNNEKEIETKLNDAINKVNIFAYNQIIEIKNSFSEKRKDIELKNNKLIRSKETISNKLLEIINGKELISNAESDLKSIKKELQLKEEEKFDDNLKNSLKEEIKKFKKEVKEKYNNIENILLYQLDILNFWKKEFSPTGIPSLLIDESLPFMNERISYYLDLFSGGRYQVSFDTQKETKSGEFRDKIEMNILDTQSLSDSGNKFSSGQSRLVDIATILTLSDLQSAVQDIKFNIMLFDEIYDSLDSSNSDTVSNVLKLLSTKKHIFIISHRLLDMDADEVLQLNN